MSTRSKEEMVQILLSQPECINAGMTEDYANQIIDIYIQTPDPVAEAINYIRTAPASGEQPQSQDNFDSWEGFGQNPPGTVVFSNSNSYFQGGPLRGGIFFPSQFPPQQSQFPPQQSQFPPQQSQFPPQQSQFPPQQSQFPPQQSQFPPQQSQFPPQQGQFPPQQQNQNYPNQQQNPFYKTPPSPNIQNNSVKSVPSRSGAPIRQSSNESLSQASSPPPFKPSAGPGPKGFKLETPQAQNRCHNDMCPYCSSPCDYEVLTVKPPQIDTRRLDCQRCHISFVLNPRTGQYQETAFGSKAIPK